jgi:hypothetical protein
VSVAELLFTVVYESFVNTARYRLPLSAETGVNERGLLTAPLMSVHVAPPFVDCCHWMAGEPNVVVAAEAKDAERTPPMS